MIGDPGGGRQNERNRVMRSNGSLPRYEIRQAISRFRLWRFRVGGRQRRWIEPIDVISFLRDIGKHFSVNAMIKETVRRRLEDDSMGVVTPSLAT